MLYYDEFFYVKYILFSKIILFNYIICCYIFLFIFFNIYIFYSEMKSVFFINSEQNNFITWNISLIFLLKNILDKEVEYFQER